MPGVSADATEAALVDWAVEPGATVKRGDVLASIETDKAVVELEAEEDAVLFKTLVAAGEMVPIGGPIAVFVAPGEEAQGEEAILGGLGLGPQASGPLDGADEERSQDALVPGAKEAEIDHTADAVVAGNGAARTRIFASPLARRLAVEAGLRIEDLEGTGPGGRIRRRDIDAALSARGTTSVLEVATPAAPPAPAAAPVPAPTAPIASSPAPGEGFTDIPHSRFRRAVAGALTASKQQVPHFYLKATCRMDDLLDLRRRVNTESGHRITINDFVVKAAARAMVEVPEMNVAWTPDAVRRFDSVDIAVAVDSDRGLMTPVVRAAHGRSLSDLSATIKDLAARAGAGTLKQQELEGGSLAISNLGMFGIEEFAAIINPPQAGILAVGTVTSRPVQQEDGGVGFGQFMTVVLSADHRPVDGALAARWMAHFLGLLEAPLRILV
jgi:pyruvate dehydrogenase E2 component (dihydrolipoamide acetyltransferase)